MRKIKQLLLKIPFIYRLYQKSTNLSTQQYEKECIEKYQNKVFGRPDEVEEYYAGLLEEMNTGQLPWWKTNFKYYKWEIGTGKVTKI